MSRLLRTASATVAVAAGIALLPAAAAQAADPQTAPHSWTVTEHFDQVMGPVPCLTEFVHVVGDITTVYVHTTTGTGNVLTSGHTVASMQAVGVDSGQAYTLVDIREIETSIVANGDGFVENGSWAFLLVSRGSGENFVFTAHEHVVLTPNGDVVASSTRGEETCLG